MYSYEWDAQTGGLLLNSSPLSFSKEPRPVYYKELDILGFDKYWNYAKNDTYPYMWAEANNYFYRGRLVVKLDIMKKSAFSFGVIFTGPNPDDNLLAHEYGHTVHLSQIGIANYVAKVVVPSVTSFWIYRENPYYTSQPWEYIAEYFGKTARPSDEYLACADEWAIIYWIFTFLP